MACTRSSKAESDSKGDHPSNPRLPSGNLCHAIRETEHARFASHSSEEATWRLHEALPSRRVSTWRPQNSLKKRFKPSILGGCESAHCSPFKPYQEIRWHLSFFLQLQLKASRYMLALFLWAITNQKKKLSFRSFCKRLKWIISSSFTDHLTWTVQIVLTTDPGMVWARLSISSDHMSFGVHS